MFSVISACVLTPMAMVRLLFIVFCGSLMVVSESLAESSDLDVGKTNEDRSLDGGLVAASVKCESVGGTCMKEKEAAKKCKGIHSEGYTCQFNKPVCCIDDCSEENGFFRLSNSPQCFKLMVDSPNLNWKEAQALCEKHPNLKLAHPWNSIEIRRYILQRYGMKQAFLNAKGNGRSLEWQDNGEEITEDNPLWIGNSHPFSSGCLIINYLDFDTKPNQPFWCTYCDTKLDYRYPLCEVVYE